MNASYQQIQAELRAKGKALLLTYLPADQKEAAQKYLCPIDAGERARAFAERVEFKKLSRRFPQIEAAAADCLEHYTPAYLEHTDGDAVFFEAYKQEPRLIILGGGTISLALVPMAVELGFAVTVCDDRLTFANAERFPAAERVVCAPFDELFEELMILPSDYVVIVTRGHQYDRSCLEHVLPIQPDYLGMIGSRHRVRALKRLMLEQGYEAAELERMASPIGLNIGAVTPEEIAVSILAQLICKRRLDRLVPADPDYKNKKTDRTDIDLEVLRELAGLSAGERVVILTVLGAKGSVPRGVGAKMLLHGDGRCTGSIGGGCAEGDALVTARRVLDQGGYAYEEVLMNNDVAAAEGMACGGRIRVLIEAV